uniref:Uncharacterized protein n=1 Tax=Panagrolaimus sp. ES5 TaxID=591445 RepID=A0AC34FJE9_9BILA
MAKVCKNSKGEDYVKLDSNLHICELQEFNPEEYLSHTVESTDFRIFNYTHRGISKSTLIIFDPSNKNLCYEFFWDNRRKLYECSGCHMSKGISAVIADKTFCYEYTWVEERRSYTCYRCQKLNRYVHARILKNKDGIEYVELSRNEHKCELQKFVPEQKWDEKIVKASNFKIEEDRTKIGTIVKRLIIFDSNDATLCHIYNHTKRRDQFYCTACKFRNKYVTAKLHHSDEPEKSYVELNSIEHVCEAQKYNLLKVITKSDYVLHECVVDGFKRKFVIIFDPTDKNLCYHYCYYGTDKAYLCVNCRKMDTLVSARFNKNKNSGEEYLSLNKTQHACKSIKYIPEEFSSRIVTFGNYKVEVVAKDGVEKKSLIVNNSTIKNLYYSYIWSEKDGFYICRKCNHKNVNARILRNSNDEEYVALSEKSHLCKPLKRV